LLSFESPQSFYDVKVYVKIEPKMSSGNTCLTSNLYGKEIIIRTTSKILSETEKISRWHAVRVT